MASTISPDGYEVTCEVCGTRQPPATECVECGIKLSLPEGVEPFGDRPIESLPGLELTVMQPVGELARENLPDFEPTVSGETGPAREELLLDLEPTAAGELDRPRDNEHLPDFEQTFEPFDKSGSTYEAYPRACPYCGFEQASGRVCNNCGRSRFRVLPAPAKVAAVVLKDDELPSTRCRGCGSYVVQRVICTECGQPLPPIES